jgi:hypothetical protein
LCDQETSKKEEAKARYRAVKIQPQRVVTPGKQTNILTTVILTSTSNSLPDDGVTALKHVKIVNSSCFNVSINVYFKIVFKIIHLRISW